MSETATKNSIAVCTIDAIGMKITGDDAQPLIEALNEYLSVFAAPVKRDNANFLQGGTQCLNCERALSGALGTFKWGLQEGEGACSNCGWPCRALHRPKDEHGDIFDGTLEFILQYHPNHGDERRKREHCTAK